MARSPYPRLRLVGGVVALVLVGGATLGDLPSILEQRGTESAPLPESMTRLVLTASRGDVRVSEISAGEQPSVQADSTWTLSRPRLTTHGAGSSVQVEAPCSGNNLGECHADLTVRVPAGTTLEIESTFGQVHLSSTGEVTARSTVGDILLDGEPERTSLTSTLGDISVTTPSGAPDSIHVRTTVGDVDLLLPSAATYAVAASSVHGLVDVRVPRDLDSPHTVDVETTLGEVDVRAAN